MSKAGMIDIGLTSEQFETIDDSITKAHQIVKMLKDKASDGDGTVEALELDIVFDYLDKANQMLLKR